MAQYCYMFYFIINAIYEYLALSCPGVFYISFLNHIYFQYHPNLYLSNKNIDEIQNHSSYLSYKLTFFKVDDLTRFNMFLMIQTLRYLVNNFCCLHLKSISSSFHSFGILHFALIFYVYWPVCNDILHYEMLDPFQMINVNVSSISS